ncbi:MAG: DUF4253 domain-containing protein, partial [Sphingomonas sp.]
AAAAGPDEAEAMRERMRKALPFRRVTVTGADALKEWERLRALGEGWPVVIGGDEALDRIAEQFSLDDSSVFPQPTSAPAPRSPQAILSAASGVKLPGALETLWREEYGGDADDEAMPAIGKWPAPTAALDPGFTIARDIMTGKPLARVHILVLPTRDSAEVPAYLRWGGWNACPMPEIHVAVLRDWNRRYGVELVGIDGDTINLRATRRPASRDEALALAREQFFYCPDIVYQGTDTLAPLAAGLMASDWWFFWWD